MAKIQIFSVLGKNGELLANFLYKTMSRLSSREHELEFNCFMSSKADSDPPPNWICRGHVPRQKHTSLNHTVGLNESLEFVNGDYIIISDVDVAMLTKKWDNKIIKYMHSNILDIVGIDFWNNKRGYKDFPIVTFFMSKTASYLKAKPDLRPNLVPYANKYGHGANVITIKTEQDSDIFGMSLGSEFLQDSGWQLPVAYKKHGFKSKTFDKGRAYSIDNVPQLWTLNGEPIVCHKGKTRRNKHVMSDFTKSVSKYLSF